MKIIFMGTPNFAVPILRSIYDSGHKILEVILNQQLKVAEVKKLIIQTFLNVQSNSI